MSSFTEIPILDLSLARSPDTKPQFLESLHHALLEVGFLYIKNAGIEDDLVNEVVEQGKAFFDLPIEAKLEIEMKNGWFKSPLPHLGISDCVCVTDSFWLGAI
jgi:isopenicillin N synthase-like dioxygenase